MPRPLEGQAVRHPVKGDRWWGPLHLGLIGLLSTLAGLCLLLLLRNAPSVAAQQAGTGPLTRTPAFLDPTATPTPTPTGLETPTDTSTPEATPTPSASPTMTPTLWFVPTLPPWPEDNNDLQASESLWGTDQACSENLADAGNSIDLAFNDATASCGPFAYGSTWTYTALQDTTLINTVVQALLEVRFYASGWTNDPIDLEVYDGTGWQTVVRYATTNPPPVTLTTLSYDVSDIFTTLGEANGAQVRFVGGRQANPDGHTLHLDEARLEVSDVVQVPTPLPTLGPMPTPTAPVPAPTDVPLPGDPHVDYTATTASCAGCHRAHTARGLALRQAWPEESLCFGCHASGGAGTDVEVAFRYTNTSTGFFKHDVAFTSGIHRIGEEEGSDFGAGNRHVECEDCHEPHEATRGPASAPMLQREMNDVPGVDPVWTASGTPGAYLWLARAEREYQVCFKCHSGFTILPGYAPDGWDGSSYVPDGLRKLTNTNPRQVPDSRDMAREFNPYNTSFHPVVAQGRNQTMPPGSFVPGWSATSMMYCSDCHSNPYPATEGVGPHGSPLLHLLSGLADYQTFDHDEADYTGTEVCFNCHDEADYIGNGSDSNFRRGNRNLHAQHSDDGSCYLCHDSHGSEQLHLLNLDLSVEDGSDTYLLPGYDGQPTNSQTFWQISPDGSEKTCWLVCHNHDHEGSTYPNVSD